MTSVSAKLRSWSRAARPVSLGPNEAVLPWVEAARAAHSLTPSEYDVLRVVASWTRHKTWDGSRLCIAWITERVGWARRTVERALASLRSRRLLLQDGEIAVAEGRPVVRYRLGGTPEWGLPEEVWEAREADETAGQTSNGVYTLQTAGAVTSCRTLHTDETTSEGCVSLSSAEQNETTTQPQPMDDARRPSYVRPGALNPAPRTRVGASARKVTSAARKAAERLLALPWAVTPACPQEAVTKAAKPVKPFVELPSFPSFHPAPSAVTYSTLNPEGASMTPFTDPTLGALPRDARYFYLGIRSLCDASGQVNSDPRYLKSQVFPYDDDVTADTINDMVEIMILSGKAIGVPGGLALTDPPVIKDVEGLFELTDKHTGHIPTAKLSDPLVMFEEFWKVWPRRQGKGAARKAFLAAVARGVDASFIVASAAAYGQRCQLIGKEAQFIPHPSTWINQERYDDDPEAAPQVRSKVDDAFRQSMELALTYQQQEIEGGSQKEIGW